MALLIISGVLMGLDSPKIQLNQPTPWVGVTERIMLGVVMLWFAALAALLLRGKGSGASEGTDGGNGPG